MKRIKRERTKGWRKPSNTRCVDRSTRWGNPYPVGTEEGEYTLREALRLYETWLDGKLAEDPSFLDPLVGKDLACWCSFDEDCHADILLRRLREWARALVNNHINPRKPLIKASRYRLPDIPRPLISASS